MAVTTLTPGAVTVDDGSGGPPNPGSGVIGSPPQWADGSDSTYATVQNATFINDVALASCAAGLPGEVLSIVANGRLSATGAATVFVGVQLEDVVAFEAAEFEVPGDGVIRDFSVSMELDEPADWMNVPELTARLVPAFPNGTTVNIYEVSFTVTIADPDTSRPATRLYPRKDDLGLSAAPRLVGNVPPERLVGGYY